MGGGGGGGGGGRMNVGSKFGCMRGPLGDLVVGTCGGGYVKCGSGGVAVLSGVWALGFAFSICKCVLFFGGPCLSSLAFLVGGCCLGISLEYAVFKISSSLSSSPSPS